MLILQYSEYDSIIRDYVLLSWGRVGRDAGLLMSRPNLKPRPLSKKGPAADPCSCSPSALQALQSSCPASPAVLLPCKPSILLPCCPPAPMPLQSCKCTLRLTVPALSVNACSVPSGWQSLHSVSAVYPLVDSPCSQCMQCTLWLTVPALSVCSVPSGWQSLLSVPAVYPLLPPLSWRWLYAFPPPCWSSKAPSKTLTVTNHLDRLYFSTKC